ncbi:MAG: MFS transporter [Solirubrobacterales bacterium]|nr:MFS transporter [Solirubrobacterales bacterium]
MDVGTVTGSNVGAPNGRASVAARLDRIPPCRMHVRISIAAGLANFFDLYDVFLGGVLAAVLATKWHLTTDGKALVIGSGFGGMFVGAVFLSRLADRFGRRKMFIVNLVCYSIFSLAAAFSPNLTWLAILRFLGGFGLGAELSLSDAYLTELLPRAIRGRYISAAYTLGFIGVPLAAFVGAEFVAKHTLLIDGWRWLLVLGSLGAVLVLAIRRRLPESPRWYEMQGQHAQADRVTTELEAEAEAQLGLERLPTPEPIASPPPTTSNLRAIFEPPYARRSAMLWFFQFFQTVGYYGFGTLAPLVLAAKGFHIVSTLGFTAIIYMGYPLGSAGSVPIIERFERKHLITASALIMAGLGVVFGFARVPWLIVTAGFLLTATSNVFSNAFHIYQAEIFPTRIRATAVGTAYSLSRLSGAILPFISVSVLDHLGASTVFIGSAVIMALIATDIAVLGPRSTGLNLEDASDDHEAPASARTSALSAGVGEPA